MQYKIPINIENEDPIVFGLSIRQLMIIAAWWWLWFASFRSLEWFVWSGIAWIPAIIFTWIAVIIAIFKYSEMTFMVFLLAWIRSFVNQKERYWQKWIDSFHALDIGYVIDIKNKVKKVDFWNKVEKIKTLEEQLKKI